MGSLILFRAPVNDGLAFDFRVSVSPRLALFAGGLVYQSSLSSSGRLLFTGLLDHGSL